MSQVLLDFPKPGEKPRIIPLVTTCLEKAPTRKLLPNPDVVRDIRKGICGTRQPFVRRKITR